MNMEYGEKTPNLTFVKSLWKQMILRTDMASKINPLLKIGIGKEIVVLRSGTGLLCILQTKLVFLWFCNE